jgi:hypothetical protein
MLVESIADSELARLLRRQRLNMLELRSVGDAFEHLIDDLLDEADATSVDEEADFKTGVLAAAA